MNAAFMERVHRAIEDGLRCTQVEDGVVVKSIAAQLLMAGLLALPDAPRYILRERQGKFRRWAVCDTADRGALWPGRDIAAFVEKEDAQLAVESMNARHR